MGKEDDRHDDRGKPYVGEIKDRNVRLVERKPLDRRPDAQDGGDHNVEQERERDNVPADQHITANARFLLVQNRKRSGGYTGEDIKVRSVKRHYFGDDVSLEQP
jgi:hypothetical protein